MHHHRCVHAVERAAFEEEDLAASALLGWCPDDGDREAELVDERCERDRCSDCRRGDDVVTACMTDAGQRVVLRTDREVERTVADATGERGR